MMPGYCKIGIWLSAAILLAAPCRGLTQTGDAPQAAKTSLKAEIKEVLSDVRLQDKKPELEAFFSDIETGQLPAGPFLSKVREGLAKKVKAGKILKALKSLRARYMKARGLLEASGIGSSAQALGAVSDMLAAGVKEAHVGSLLGELETLDETGKQKGAVLLSACLLRLRDSGLDDEEALKRTLKAFQKQGLEGVKKEISQSKALKKTSKSKKSLNHKNKQKAKDIHKVQGFGGPKGGKSHGK
jgi:hypothetical protein